MRQLRDLVYQLWMASPIGIAIYLALMKLSTGRRAVLILFSVASTIGLLTGIGGYAAYAIFSSVLNIGCAFTLTPCLNATLGSNGFLLLILFYVMMVFGCLCWGVPKVCRDFCRSMKLVVGTASPPPTPRVAPQTPRDPTPLATPEPSPRTSQMMQLFSSFDVSGDGLIDVNELGNAMRRLNVHPDVEQLNQMIVAVDYDSSGFLSFDEFVTIVEHFRSQPPSSPGGVVASKHSLLTSGEGGGMGFWSVLGDWAAKAENTELPENKRTRDSAVQTVWQRNAGEDFRKWTASMTMKQDQTYERFKLSRSCGSTALTVAAPDSRHGPKNATISTQTFLSGQSPYSGMNPPRSWLPQAIKTREMATQSDRPAAKKPAPPSTALVVSKTTCDVGVQSFLPVAQKPSRYMKHTHNTALLRSEEVRAIVVRDEDRPQTSTPKTETTDTGCGPGPWIWKEADRRKADDGSPPTSTLVLVRSPLRDESASPRMPKISLVFYNARTSFKTKQSTPRRLTRSAAWGPSVDEIEPTTHFAPLPGIVHFYVRLRTIERPVLDGPGWKKPLQTASGYASKRSIIWPTAALDVNRIIGYEPHINLHLARVLELEVCVPGDHKGINPTLETHYHQLNLETVRNRLVLEDGTTRISIPLKTRPRAGLEEFIGRLKPGAPPSTADNMLLSPASVPALMPPEEDSKSLEQQLPAPEPLPEPRPSFRFQHEGASTPTGELVPRSISPFLPRQQQPQQYQEKETKVDADTHLQSPTSSPTIVPPLPLKFSSSEEDPLPPPNIYTRDTGSSTTPAEAADRAVVNLTLRGDADEVAASDGNWFRVSIVALDQ